MVAISRALSSTEQYAIRDYMKSQAVFLHSPQQKYFKAGSVRSCFVCQCCGGWIWPYVRAHCENSLDLLGLGLSARRCLLFQLSAQPWETWCHPVLPATQQLVVPKHTRGNKHTVPPTHRVTTNTDYANTPHGQGQTSYCIIQILSEVITSIWLKQWSPWLWSWHPVFL